MRVDSRVLFNLPAPTGSHLKLDVITVVEEHSSDLHLLIAHHGVGQPQVDEEILHHCDLIGVRHTDPCVQVGGLCGVGAARTCFKFPSRPWLIPFADR